MPSWQLEWPLSKRMGRQSEVALKVGGFKRVMSAPNFKLPCDAGDAGQPIDPREEARLTAVEARLNALLTQLPASSNGGKAVAFVVVGRQCMLTAALSRTTACQLQLCRGKPRVVYRACCGEQPDAAA